MSLKSSIMTLWRRKRVIYYKFSPHYEGSVSVKAECLSTYLAHTRCWSKTKVTNNILVTSVPNLLLIFLLSIAINIHIFEAKFQHYIISNYRCKANVFV